MFEFNFRVICEVIFFSPPIWEVMIILLVLCDLCIYNFFLKKLKNNELYSNFGI